MNKLAVWTSSCVFLLLSCTAQRTTKSVSTVEYISTAADQSRLLYSSSLPAGMTTEQGPTINIDKGKTYQPIDGFGYSLTGGSAFVLYKMSPAERKKLLTELFSDGPGSIGISYLRISIGASDLDEEVFSYNDLPAGETDPSLEKFSINRDYRHLIPLLKEIKAIQPGIRLMATCWSPPVWMKTNRSSIGGRLLPAYYPAFAQYLLKYCKAYAAEGITIDAITLQNEPEHGGNNPSMLMNAAEQAELIRDHVGPAFRSANLTTRILVWDHNANHPEYPIAVLDDAKAKPFVYGSAFHLYEGDISALSKVKAAHPDKAIYFTEQWTGAKGDFGGDFNWHMKNVVLGALQNWSQVVLEWNLANDASFGPHTPGGCTECKGALTVTGDKIQRNVSYYIIAQVSRFVPPGSVRIGITTPPGLNAVAFRTPDGKAVVLVFNDSGKEQQFSIADGAFRFSHTIQNGMATTYRW